MALAMLGSPARAQDMDDSTGRGGQHIYFSFLGQLGIPQSDFRQYAKTRGGFRVEAGVPIKANSAFSAGAEISALFSSPKKDYFKGIGVNTESILINLQPFLRWTPKKQHTVRPFLDVSAGLTAVATQTTSEIIDRATFLEEILFGSDTQVVTVTHEEQSAVSFSYSAGMGFVIANWFMIGVRYQNVNRIKYVDKNAVYIDKSQIVYEEKRIPLDMFTITVGITNWGK
jgi:hypothetical protein